MIGNRAITQVRALRACGVFLTRLRLGGFPYSQAEWRWAAAYLPVVGAGIGAALAALHGFFLALGPGPAAVLCVAAGIGLTGALHEDGLADTADALGGASGSPQRIREILKDSALGTYGMLALSVSLLLRVSLLAELADRAAFALVVSQGLARLPLVWLLASMDYVTHPDSARNRGFAEQVGAAQAWAATGWSIALCAVVLAASGLPWTTLSGAMLVLIGIAAISRSLYRRALGGVTGDFLGATEQATECSLLLALALALRAPPIP